MCSFLGVITLRPADIADASTAMGETDSFFRSTTGHFRDTTSAFRDTHNGFRDTGGVCGNRSRLRVFPKMKPRFTGHGELVFKNPPEANNLIHIIIKKGFVKPRNQDDGAD